VQNQGAASLSILFGASFFRRTVPKQQTTTTTSVSTVGMVPGVRFAGATLEGWASASFVVLHSSAAAAHQLPVSSLQQL
jgi:uncharacterized membrane protein YjjP (DUF1212 family)